MCIIAAFLAALVAFYAARILFSRNGRPFDDAYHNRIEQYIARRNRSEYDAHTALKPKKDHLK